MTTHHFSLYSIQQKWVNLNLSQSQEEKIIQECENQEVRTTVGHLSGCLLYKKKELTGSSESSLIWSLKPRSLDKFAFKCLFLGIVYICLTLLDNSFGTILQLLL